MLISKEDFHSAVERAYQKEMDYIRECRTGSETSLCEPSGEPHGYYSTVYPNGRKMKHVIKKSPTEVGDFDFWIEESPISASKW